jgi:dolichol kinase
MADALALDSRDLALDLHRLLKDLDPARWRDEAVNAASQRLDTIQTQIEELKQEFAERKDSLTDESLQALQGCVDSLSSQLAEYAPADGLALPDLKQEWMDFRTSMQPAYENLADGLRMARIHVPSLRPTNYTRNVFHALSAMLSLVLVEMVLTPGLMMYIAILVAASAWSMEIGKRVSPTVDRATWWVFGRMGHPYERRRINSATWFSSALAVLSLTRSHMLAAVALVILGLADPAAGLIGRRFGRIKLIHGRSVEGTSAFILVGLAGAMGVLAIWHGELGWPLMLGLSAAAVLPAALAELLAYRIDDNLLVPASAAAGAGAFALAVGIPL